jgi:hypothetical protein
VTTQRQAIEAWRSYGAYRLRAIAALEEALALADRDAPVGAYIDAMAMFSYLDLRADELRRDSVHVIVRLGEELAAAKSAARDGGSK